MTIVQFIRVYPNGTKKLVSAVAETGYAAEQELSEEEYQQYKTKIKCINATAAEAKREEKRLAYRAELQTKKLNKNKNAAERKAREEQIQKPAPVFSVKDTQSHTLEEVRQNNTQLALSSNGNKRAVGDDKPQYTPSFQDKEAEIRAEQWQAVQAAQKKSERENRNAVNRGRTQEQNTSGINIQYGKNGSKSAEISKKAQKTNKAGSIYKDCKTIEDAQKKWSEWAYQQSIEQFCKEKGLTYVQGVTDNLYIEAQKKDPYLFYNGTYYTGMNQGLRDQFIKNESALQNFKINQKLSAKITIDPTIVSGAKKAFDNASANWKPTQQRLAKNISDGWVNLRNNAYDEWMRGRKNFVEARKKLEANIDKANTIGKTLTHDPAKLFEAGIDEYIKQHPDDAEAKYMKEHSLSGAEIIGALTGKYNKDDNCRKDVEKLSNEIDKVQKDPSLSNKYNEDYFNKQIEHINKTYGLKIPPYCASTAKALKSTLEGNKRYQVKKSVKHLATLMMDRQMDAYLDKNIQGVLDKFNAKFGTNHKDSPELREKIRQVIRGTYTVTFNQDKLMKDLEKKTEEELERFLGNQVENRLYNSDGWKKFMHLDEDVGDIYRKKLGGEKLDKFGQKLDSWAKLSDVDFTLKLTESLTDQLNNKIGFLGNTQNTLNKLDQKMGQFGLGLGLGPQFSALEKTFTLNIASSMEHQLKTSMQGTLKSISKVTTTVQNFQKQIQGIQNQARDLVKKWESTAMDMVKAQQKVIVNNIMKSVKIDFSGGIGSFKI